MSEWKEYKLGDVTQWSSGGTPSKSNDAFWGGDIPWVSATSMKGNRFADSALKITEAGLNSGSRLAKRGSVLLLVRGSTLHQRILVGVTERDVAFNQDVKAIVPNEEFLDSWYLLFWFMSIEKDLLNMVENTGIGAGKLDTELLQNLIIKIPPKEEREKIKACAKAIDDKLVLNSQTNQTLEQIAQAIFKSWFVDFEPTRAKIAAKKAGQDPERAAMAAISGKTQDQIDHLTPEQQTQLKTTAALFPDALIDSELGEIPDGWDVKPNGDVMDVRDGTHDSPKQSEEGFPLVTSKHITSGVLKIKEAYLISKEDYEKVNKRSRVSRGDILLTMIGTVGIPYLVTQPDVNFAIKNVGLFRTSEVKEYKNYFYLLLKSPEMQSYLDARMAGTTQKYLSLKTLRSIKMIEPKNDLLGAFNNIVNPLIDKIFTSLSENEDLEDIRDTLLPELLNGNIALKDVVEVE